MAKIDKSQYTKSEWQQIREQRRSEKKKESFVTTFESDTHLEKKSTNNSCAFVLGNGTSRKGIEVNELQNCGRVYGCNALYRTHNPDYLVAVDVKMVAEIAKSGYQHRNEVWTNPNRSFSKFHNLNFFHPAKGWSSGPTALWLASQHDYRIIYILGFDYKGIDDGKKFNNVYADTMNYKKSRDSATFFGNWLRQTKTVIKDHPNIQYRRVITADNYCPEELNRFDNFKTIRREDFEKIFNLK